MTEFKYLGFWKEYSRNEKHPSIYELKNEDVSTGYNEQVVEYLNKGIVIFGAAYTEISKISGEEIAPSKKIYTDGEWFWTTEFIYYYKRYNFLLPREFLNKIIERSYLPLTRTALGENYVSELEEIVWREKLKTSKS